MLPSPFVSAPDRTPFPLLRRVETVTCLPAVCGLARLVVRVCDEPNSIGAKFLQMQKLRKTGMLDSCGAIFPRRPLFKIEADLC
jgi:hypothetical protein